MRVYLNDKFVEEEESRISAFDPGFLYAQGLFETMRSYSGRIFRLDSHIKRLTKSAALVNLKLGPDKEYLKNILKACLRQNNIKDGYLRLTIWQGQDRLGLWAFAKNYNSPKQEDYKKGFKVMISRFTQNEQSILSGIKSSSRLHLLLAYQEAKARAKEEALLLNTRGFIAEASQANVFMVKDNCLITPSLACGCLAGITRDTVLGIAEKERIKVIETEITSGDLKNADEAFLSNSLIEIMPLVAFEQEPIKKGSPGRITEMILKRYRDLTIKA